MSWKRRRGQSMNHIFAKDLNSRRNHRSLVNSAGQISFSNCFQTAALVMVSYAFLRLTNQVEVLMLFSAVRYCCSTSIFCTRYVTLWSKSNNVGNIFLAPAVECNRQLSEDFSNDPETQRLSG